MQGEGNTNCCITQHDRFRRGSVIVWTGICIDGRTDLYVIDGVSLTSIRNRDDTFHLVVKPFAGAVMMILF